MPSLSISAIRSALLELEMPSTATIEAMPIAMPIAVSRVRPLRLRNPCSR